MKFYTNVRTYGNSILWRYVDGGIRYQQKLEYSPTLYVPSNKKTNFSTMFGESVKELPMGSINEARQFVKTYESVDNFKIYGNTKWHYQFITENYPEKDIQWDISQLKIANFDIEVDSSQGMPKVELANREVISIAYRINDQYWVYGLKDFVSDRKDLRYVKCSNERELLLAFLNRWASDYPDIITGWNIEFFDIPYLAKRIELVLGEKEMKRLSPWGIVSFREVNGLYGKKPRPTYELVGVSTVDYIDAYKKFVLKPRESYKLDFIAEVELDEKKLDYTEYGSLANFYQQNHQKFIEYNIRDVELVSKLEDKLGLIKLILTLAYKCKINFEDPFFQVRMWDTLIYNHLLSEGVVVEQPKKNNKDSKYEGAYVKQPKTGRYKHIASFDATSLYPKIICQYNISPETLVEYHDLPPQVKLLIGDSKIDVDTLLNKQIDLSMLKSFNLTVTPNGQFFRTDVRGFLPNMIENMFNERKQAKNTMLHHEAEMEKLKKSNPLYRQHKDSAARYSVLEKGLKVTLNSAYGATGNAHFRFFDIRIASAITSAGQLSIRWVQQAIDNYLNGALNTTGVEYVIYVDTDSNYVCLDDIVKRKFPNGCSPEEAIKFMDMVCEKKLQPFINKTCTELSDYVNAYAQEMHFKREVLADSGIWTGKKRYALNVHNSEGIQYAEPKLKVMGLELVKSSTPAVCKDKMKKCVDIMLNGDESELHSFVKQFKNDFLLLSANNIAFPRGVNGVDEYSDESSLCKKGTPIHVRGSLVYNKLIRDMKLQNTYPMISDGDKIKFSYLVEPNPTKQNVIAFPDELPVEFQLDRYIDSMLQFEKSFLEPIRGIATCVGWDTKKKTTLSKFKKVV